ncbi:very-long-chain 3-oxoacyl-CoA reductase 1-like [Nymphaea colorata]|nr:very-long-chain 3-oxoacyl-CoA reductase 1-like [Nymphaea colorata]
MVFQTFLLLPTVLGLVHICRALMELAWWVWASFLRPMRNLKEYGPWAIVTGPTDEIGKAIAFRLARYHGVNLVLVGRNPSKLRSVSSEILKMNRSIEVRSIEVDLAGDINEGMEKIREGIRGPGPFGIKYTLESSQGVCMWNTNNMGLTFNVRLEELLVAIHDIEHPWSRQVHLLRLEYRYS